MNVDIHRAALRAAARLALSAAFPATLLACGSSADPSAASSSASTSADSTGGKSSADEASSCVKEYCSETSPDDTLASCCKAEVADATFPTDMRLGPNPDTRVDELTRGCCKVLADEWQKDHTLAWPRTECCDAIGWSAAGTCSPWGPPVPPSMNRKNARAARRLAVA